MLRRKRRPVKAYAPTIPTPPPSGVLPFDMPNMSSSPKKVLAHWHYFPVSLDNLAPATDYWATNWMRLDGVGSATHFGGRVRDRPRINGTPPLPGDWKRANCLKEIEDAISVGVDGFFMNTGWLTYPPADGGGWPLLHHDAMIDAATDHPGFLVVPMVDCIILGAVNVTNLAARIAVYHGKASTWMDGGTMIVGVFYTQVNTPAYWDSLAATLLANHGITAKFVHVYSAATAASTYASKAYATGVWGPKADAGIPLGSTSPSVSSVHGRGEKFLSPVWISDERPESGVWNESLNTTTLRNYWTEVINQAAPNNADIVQLCTWQDYSEGSEFGDSILKGMVAADISAYYLVRWKTGSFPAIVRDALYLSYRNHTSTASRLGAQSQTMAKWTTPGTPTRFAVEALTFLTAPADVTVTIAGTTTTFTNVPAGLQVNTVLVTTTGNVSGTIRRAGTTIVNLPCPIPIRSSLWNDSWRYCMFGSLRGTAGQFDCQMTSSNTIPTYP